MIVADDMVSPEKVIPPHEITFPHYVAELMLDMQRRGWRGRPLLVELVDSERYKAWTGSHRIAAANMAKLPTVPIVFVDTSALKFLGLRRRGETVFCGGTIDFHKLPPVGSEVAPTTASSILADAVPVSSATFLSAIGGDQEEWLEALVQAKDDRSAQLLRYEIRLNRRQWKRDKERRA